MKVIDDGIIKYDRSNFTQCGPLEIEEYSALEYWREKLFDLNLIGEYKEEQVGFGNLSKVMDYTKYQKTTNSQFVITSTQSGKYRNLDGSYYSRVLDYDINTLKIKVMGPKEASSEALTHAAIYSHNKKIKVIFHIHSAAIWKGMINDQYDFTAKNIPYGTVEMAHASQKCIADKTSGIFCMHGHTDGVISYAENLEDAGKLILDVYQKYHSIF